VDGAAAYDAGIRWELAVAREEGQRLAWRLESLKS
jgi:hypothetical protein